ncbi:hypothetical protein CHS0354_035945 [Potamilus streckersoni]|uniref:Uncharacterized protein n=1 Tax=Potamilus streckersoni TaxID=2493646 RepID=A0AAE0WDS2_9BIVA|nr:hypothetical protein CHS0354_035945 [Potamilus streckersoni]
MPDNCFGLQCCLNFSIPVPFSSLVLKRYIPFWFKLDPCDFRIDMAFGPHRFNERFITLDWGEEHILSLADGAIQIKFTVNKMANNLGFIVDLKLLICIPNGDKPPMCIPSADGLPLLQGEEIPACNARAYESFKNFSLTNWVSEMLANKTDQLTSQLTSAATQLLLDQLGITKYLLKPQCDHTRYPYSPSVNGWNNECPLGFIDLPPIPEKLPINCHIAESCTALDCCIFLEKLGLSFHVAYAIDMCSYKMSGSIEKINFEIPLLLYNDWGKKERFTILDFLTFEFSIRKLEAEKKFLIDLDISACFEANGNCMMKLSVMKGTEVPQPICDLSATLSIYKNFSLTSWMKNHALDTMTDAAVKFLLEQLGIDTYLLNPPCSAKDLIYQGAVNGWKNACFYKKLTLPTLPSGVVCSVSETCTHIDCCVTVDALKLSMHTYLNLDFCNFEISYGIEKLTGLQKIFSYNWGQKETLYLDSGNMIYFSYSIGKLDDSKMFVVNLDFNVCLEKGQPCQLSLPFMKDALIPQPLCNTNVSFVPGEFSLTSYMDKMGWGKALSSAAAKQLLDMLGLTKNILLNPACDRNKAPYSAVEPYWTNECSFVNTSSLPKLDHRMSCYIPKYCTAINCCLRVEKLAKSFLSKIDLNPCNNTFDIAIENFKKSFVLLDYASLAVSNSFWLFGIFRADYKIEDLDRFLLFSLNLSLCFETDFCEISVPVMKNTKLPKSPCEWGNVLKLPDTSNILNQLITDAKGQLTNYLVESTWEKLGISKYLLLEECKVSQPGQWVKLCNRTLPMTLPTLPNNVTCTLGDTCMSVQCCVDINFKGQHLRSFSFDIALDACNYFLDINIENLLHKYQLLNYEFGTKHQYSLNGIANIDYSITDLKADKLFVLNMNLTVCFEKQSCVFELNVLKNLQLPKPLCSDKFPGLKLNEILQAVGDSVTDQLADYTADLIFNKLGISQYIQSTPCDHAGRPYQPSDDKRWNSTCPIPLNLPALPNNVACHIPDICTGFDCCVYFPLLGRSFHIMVKLDACNYLFTLQLENWKKEIVLLEYEFGTPGNVSLHDVFQFRYKVLDLPSQKKFVVSLEVIIKVCDDTDKCGLSLKLLEDVKVPKPFCDWSANNFLQNFSYSNFVSSVGGQLTDLAISELLEKLGLKPYLLPVDLQCKISAEPFNNPSNGWNNHCDLSLILPSLTGRIANYLPANCSGVETCIEVSQLRRSIHLYFYFNYCDYILRIGIEKYDFTLKLLDYTWGTAQEFSLNSAIRVRYSLELLSSQNKLQVDLEIKICFDKDYCPLVFPLLSKTKFPLSVCDFAMTYLNPDFNLKNWLAEQGASLVDGLKDSAVDYVLEQLGIAVYFKDTPCNRQQYPYLTSDSSGWHKECPLDLALPTLPSVMSCHIPEFCTGVDCCVDVPGIRHPISARFILDGCKLYMNIGIERKEVNISLNNFSWDSMNGANDMNSKFSMHSDSMNSANGINFKFSMHSFNMNGANGMNSKFSMHSDSMNGANGMNSKFSMHSFNMIGANDMNSKFSMHSFNMNGANGMNSKFSMHSDSMNGANGINSKFSMHSVNMNGANGLNSKFSMHSFNMIGANGMNSKFSMHSFNMIGANDMNSKFSMHSFKMNGANGMNSKFSMHSDSMNGVNGMNSKFSMHSFNMNGVNGMNSKFSMHSFNMNGANDMNSKFSMHSFNMNGANDMNSKFSMHSDSMNGANGMNSKFSMHSVNMNGANGINSKFSMHSFNMNGANGMNSKFSMHSDSMNGANGMNSKFSMHSDSMNGANGMNSKFFHAFIQYEWC